MASDEYVAYLWYCGVAEIHTLCHVFVTINIFLFCCKKIFINTSNKDIDCHVKIMQAK